MVCDNGIALSCSGFLPYVLSTHEEAGSPGILRIAQTLVSIVDTTRRVYPWSVELQGH